MQHVKNLSFLWFSGMRFQSLEVRSSDLVLPKYGQSLLEDSRAEIRNLYDFHVTYFFVIIILRTYGFLEEKGISFKKFSLQKIKLLDLTTITLVTMQKCFIIRKTGNRGFRMQNVGT